MQTKRITVNRDAIEKDKIKEAAEILKQGGLVAFPTETVYGLGGDAKRPEVSKKIYAAKGRPSDNPLIVHIADFSELKAIASDIPPAAEKLAAAFWPGPMTLIVNKNEVIPYETTGGLDTVAVRMPSHPVARMLIQESGCMIAAPSANTSGRPSPTTAQHVWQDLDGKIDCIVDGGPVEIGLESTIVDLTVSVPTILRPGYITQEMLEKVVGEVAIDPGIIKENVHIRPKAPGMRYKHYAPKGNLIIVSGEEKAVVEKINVLTREGIQAGKKVGILGTTETRERYPAGEVLTIGDRRDEESIARHLFGALRKFDDMGVQLIYSESFEAPGIGQAVMNRLLKAAGHQVIDLTKQD